MIRSKASSGELGADYAILIFFSGENRIMQCRPILAGGLLANMTFSMYAETTNLVPPVANRVEHREERHGATVLDHYYWLREKSNPEVVKYLEGENAYTAALTKS